MLEVIRVRIVQPTRRKYYERYRRWVTVAEAGIAAENVLAVTRNWLDWERPEVAVETETVHELDVDLKHITVYAEDAEERNALYKAIRNFMDKMLRHEPDIWDTDFDPSWPDRISLTHVETDWS
jgi:hypothetical protein